MLASALLERFAIFRMRYPRARVNTRTTATVALLVLAVQNTALVLVTKFSYRESAEPYTTSSVILCSECVKVFLSGVLLSFYRGKDALIYALHSIPEHAASLVLPAVLYAVQNKLLFQGVRLLDPTVYMVCSQCKILTSALFSILLLGRHLNRIQISSLFLLAFGMIYSQGQTSHVPHDTSKDVHRENDWRGLLAVLTASIISGFTGAYLEKIYKERAGSTSVWSKNLQLACCSVPVIMIPSLPNISIYSFFRGYDMVVVSIVILQAIGGLVVAAVMKYASNLVKCFALSISICACNILTPHVLGDSLSETFSPTQSTGIICVIAATFLYTKFSRQC